MTAYGRDSRARAGRNRILDHPPLIPREHVEQARVVQWARLMAARWPALELLHAIPNGARTSWTQAKRLKAEGLRSGVPDLHLPVARGGYVGLWIELKRIRGGSVSPEQRWWIEALQRAGHRVIVARGADPAIAELAAYLALPPTAVALGRHAEPGGDSRCISG